MSQWPFSISELYKKIIFSEHMVISNFLLQWAPWGTQWRLPPPDGTLFFPTQYQKTRRVPLMPRWTKRREMLTDHEQLIDIRLGFPILMMYSVIKLPCLVIAGNSVCSTDPMSWRLLWIQCTCIYIQIIHKTNGMCWNQHRLWAFKLMSTNDWILSDQGHQRYKCFKCFNYTKSYNSLLYNNTMFVIYVLRFTYLLDL